MTTPPLPSQFELPEHVDPDALEALIRHVANMLPTAQSRVLKGRDLVGGAIGSGAKDHASAVELRR